MANAATPTEPRPFEMQSIVDKAVVITGGTTGIGRAVARLLAERGARVLIFGRHEPELKDALDEIQATGNPVEGITADMSQIEDVRRAFKEADARLGGVDILINNAALGAEGMPDDSYREWQQAVDTNLLGYMVCCRAAIDRMKKQGAGHIVNISSMSANPRDEDSDPHIATRSAIRGFSDSLTRAVNKDGIKVTLIEPGPVSTPQADAAMTAADKDRQELARGLASLRAEDIAECIYFCLIQPQRCDIVFLQVRPHLQAI